MSFLCHFRQSQQEICRGPAPLNSGVTWMKVDLELKKTSLLAKLISRCCFYLQWDFSSALCMGVIVHLYLLNQWCHLEECQVLLPECIKWYHRRLAHVCSGFTSALPGHFSSHTLNALNQRSADHWQSTRPESWWPLLWIMWWLMILVLHDVYVNSVPECCLNITNKETLQSFDKGIKVMENRWITVINREAKSQCCGTRDGSAACQQLCKVAPGIKGRGWAWARWIGSQMRSQPCDALCCASVWRAVGRKDLWVLQTHNWILPSRDVVEVLLRNDALTNVADSKGCYPLHLAAWKGDAQIVRLLIHQGPSHTRVNEQVGRKGSVLLFSWGQDLAAHCHCSPLAQTLGTGSSRPKGGCLLSTRCLLVHQGDLIPWDAFYLHVNHAGVE